MTVNELIINLLTLQEKGYGELPCIYSVDDEGNAYHKIHSEPEPLEVENINEYYLELAWDENGEDVGTNYNCVIIN